MSLPVERVAAWPQAIAHLEIVRWGRGGVAPAEGVHAAQCAPGPRAPKAVDARLVGSSPRVLHCRAVPDFLLDSV